MRWLVRIQQEASPEAAQQVVLVRGLKRKHKSTELYEVSENEKFKVQEHVQQTSADPNVQQAGVSSIELTSKNQPTPNQPQLNQHKKKRLSGLDYFRALEKKNREADPDKQAGLSPVNPKPINKQQQQTKPNNKNMQDKNTKNWQVPSWA